jgi:hypothetical protein
LYCVREYLNNKIMNIKETFLNLTKRTYPHGTEQDLFHLLPSNLQTDQYGNKYIQIGEDPSTMFTSHLDTAGGQLKDVNHVIKDNIIKTDGSSILGADDKAGVTVMLYMIEHNIPGLYYFFLGEEVGCVGSRKLANYHKTSKLENISKVISFDRRGKDSVITHQLGGRCCSNEFGNALALQLNTHNSKFDYTVDPSGIYTDSAQFTQIYEECTNISVGYNYEHTSSEEQDIEHLQELCYTVIKIDWENLPITRKTSDNDFDDYEDDYYIQRQSPKKENEKNSWTTEYYFTDEEWGNTTSSVVINRYTKQLVEINLTDDRLDYEAELIHDLLNSLELDFDQFHWNGFELEITYNQGNTSLTKRSEVSEYIDELNFWKSKIGEKI